MRTAEEILNFNKDHQYTEHQILSYMEEFADQFRPRWIKVTESMPEVVDDVLVFYDDLHITSAYLSSSGNFVFSHQDDDVPNVTHWMPFPKMPPLAV
jgi:hypothetical protein